MNVRVKHFFETHAGLVPMRLQVHAKLVLLLRVLPVCLSSLSDDLLSPGLLENLPRCGASRSIWLYSILWVGAKSFLYCLFFKGL